MYNVKQLLSALFQSTAQTNCCIFESFFLPVKSEFFEVWANSRRRLFEIVMRDLGEEQVVRYVAVRDIVVRIVDTPAVRSIDGLHSRCGEVEVRVVEGLKTRKTLV